MKRKSIFTTLAIALMFALSILGLTACGEKPVSYSITVTNGTANKVTAVSGDSVTITANEIDGQIFNEWIIVGFDTTDLDLTQNVLTFTMPANEVTATAVFEDVYEMELENCTSDKEVARRGEPVTFTAGEYEGKRFTGWNIKGVYTTGLDLTKSPLTITMPASDIVVAAQYEDIYKITIGHGCTTDKEYAAEGEEVTVTKPAPETGFATWWQTTGIVEKLNNRQHTVTFKMPANDIVINYIDVRLSYYFVINNGTASGLKGTKVESVTDGSTGFDYNCDVTITANTPEIGKEFSDWTITGINTSGLDLTASELTFKMPANEVTATANYNNVYTVTVVGGTAYTDGESAGSITAEYGDNINIIAEVPTGKRFVKWTSDSADVVFDSETSEITSFEMPAKNVTVTAELRDLVKSSVTVQGGVAQVGDGKLETSLEAYCGDTVTLTAYQSAEKTFVKWTIEGIDDTTGLDLTQRVLTFTMPDNNVTATAEFENVPTDLTFEGDVATSGELRYVNYDSKSFRLPLGSGQDSCTYTIELSNPAFTFKVYGSDGEVYIDENGEGVKSITIDREDNYTIEVINTGIAANCTLTVTKV